MTLYFITGNKNKFLEVSSIIKDVKQLDLDLPEIQSLDPQEVIKAKLDEAVKHQKGEFIVEDTSLFLDGLNGLPGPLIKWFMQTLGNNGIYNIVEKLGNYSAEARTVIGYTDGKNIEFFEGSVKGQIVKPTAPTNFGWDPLFQPEGYDKSFAQMTKEEKNKISMRRIAAEKLKVYLNFTYKSI